MTTKNNVYALPTLADHLEDCEQRYNSVINRLDAVDAKLDRMQSGLEDIKHLLSNVRYKTQ
jgi:hypothetical protein